MSVKDVLKKSFIETLQGNNFSPKEYLLLFAVALILALYIYYIYRILTRKTFYSKSFNISLVALTLITTAIIVTIQSSIVVSLGMVGALSIVRFRTAIKDPMDLIFLFWSISVGIICGARLYLIAILLCVILSIILFVLNTIPVVNAPQILVVNSSNTSIEENILNVVKQYTTSYKVKSRNMTADQLDMVIELRSKDDANLVKAVNAIESVFNTSLLSHDGEVTF